MEYQKKYEEYLRRTEDRLTLLCDRYLPETSLTARAARYSLFGGGKRVRAILVQAACEMLCGDPEPAADFSAAVEMLHCYSLIHDDLPCMDNDDYRRGRLSCHKAFDEATALLAGDALLTEALEAAANAPFSPQVQAQAVRLLAGGAGLSGMILGQELDLKYEAQSATEAQLLQVHRHKTGALIEAALQMGAAAAGATEEDKAALKTYGYGLGLVFQIVDDVLDVTATQEELGKPIGSDAQQGKTTFVTLYGVQGAMEYARKVNDQACAALQGYGERAEFLLTMAQKLIERKK